MNDIIERYVMGQDDYKTMISNMETEMTEEYSVAAGLDSTLIVLNVVATKVCDPNDYAEVAEQEFLLRQIRDRAELILRLIQSRKPSRLETRQ